MNFVKYDDGDDEEIVNQHLLGGMQDGLILIVAPAAVPSASVTVSPDQSSSNSPHVATRSKKRPTRVSPTPSRQIRNKKSKKSNGGLKPVKPEPISSNITAVSPTVSASEIKDTVVADNIQDARVKKEKGVQSLNSEERERREEAFRKWKEANTDPVTGEGRFVFRRGCQSSCITTILGGQGMDPWPIVERPPRLYDTNEINEFIRPGEFYVAGDEAWNPFGPRFPGDKGFVNTAALAMNPEQEEFHLFVQCADKPHKRHWHGESAKKGRMYCGVYRKVSDDERVPSTVSYKTQMNSDNQKEIARFKVKYDYRDYNGQIRPQARDPRYRERGRELYLIDIDSEDETKWYGLQHDQKDLWTLMAYLFDIDYMFEVAAVEFVRFDEALYQTLVQYGCGFRNNTARVSLEANALHYYY